MLPAPQKSIVVAHGQRLSVDTNAIADMFGRQHKNLLRDIENLVSAGAIDKLKLEPISYRDSRDRLQPAYRLSERDALVLMPYIGGRKSAQGQALLVDEFLHMRSELQRIAIRRTDPIVQLAGNKKKTVAMLMTDMLVDVRSEQGKLTKPHHFRNEHLLCNWVLTGEHVQVNDEDIDSDTMRRLADIRMRNTLLIGQGKSYTERKNALREAFPLRPTGGQT